MGDAATSTSSGVSAALEVSSKKYREIVELGRGGMATVYLTVLAGPGGFSKLQVVKRLRPALAADPEFLNMFVEEARLSARINHPNVVQTNEVGFDGTNYFIAMEYLDGESLDQIVRRAKKREVEFPLPLHLMVLSETLAGLHFAHELKDFDGAPLRVVHRDVSPHNVCVTYEGSVKVLDFGIAKAADSTNETRTGVIKGKCAYMALEQFGGKDIDRRADIFAVGIMMWQALTGQRFYPKDVGDAEIMMSLVEGKVTPPREINPAISEELQAICLRALAKDRDARFSTAAEFQAALDAYSSAQRETATRRDLGVFVASLFADRRERLRGIIEEQIKTVRATPYGVSSATSIPGSTSIPSIPSIPSISESKSDVVSGVASVTQRAQGVTVDATATVVTPTARPPSRQRAVGILIGAGVLLAVAGLATWRIRAGASASSTVPSSTDSASSSAKTPGKVVDLSIRATPANAKLFLDDTPLPSSPVTMTFTRDGTAHQLRAEAVGYETKRQVVVFDSNAVSAEIILAPAPVASASPTVALPAAPKAGLLPGKSDPKTSPQGIASAPAKTAAVAGEPALADPATIGPRPPRKIEQDDPWAPKK